MAKIYLSPSTQEYNQFYAEGVPNPETNTEEYFMNLIADAMLPYLLVNNIQFLRNTPEMTVGEIVAESNSYGPDLHVAVHSNSSPQEYDGVLQGPNIFYFPGSADGQRAAELVAEQFREIYPNPDLVAVIANDRLAEVTQTNAPAVYVEVAYHDNPSDAAWIKSHINQIARAITTGITGFFDQDFQEPTRFILAETMISEGNLNIRSAPNLNASVIGKLQNREPVVILRSLPGWYLIAAKDVTGYVDSRYVRAV